LGSPYAIRDYYAVNPEFGTLEDFRALVAETHARGMKIIIDLVANHAAWDNPLTTEHPDWFTRDRDGNLRPPVPDWSDVAEFDFSNPGLRAYMAEMMLYWVRDVGVDGFRCDVAGLVPRDFWEAVRPKLDAVKPMLMLAEDDNPAMHLEAFDLTYDWRTYDHLGRLTAGKLTPQDIRNTLTDEDLLFPRASLRLRFSTNHDKNAWDEPAIQRYGPRAAKAAAVLIFALPGVPLIYNGQEVGNDRKLGLFERVSIDFSADAHGMREFYGSLGRLRAQRVSLRRGSCEVLCDLGAPGVVGLLRTAGEERTLVLINLRDQPAHARIDRLPVTRPLNALLVSDGVRVDSTTVVLPGYGYCFGEW
jgi:glycosidase